MGAKSAQGQQARKPLREVRYRKLNIDVVFDPNNAQERQNVLNLINAPPQEFVDADGSKVTLISPLNLSLFSRASGDSRPQYPPLPTKNNPESGGLWFRECTPLEVRFEQNTEEFRRLALAALTADSSDAELVQAVADAKAALARINPKHVAVWKAANDRLTKTQEDLANVLAQEDASRDSIAQLQLNVATTTKAVVAAEQTIISGDQSPAAQNALKSARDAQSKARDAYAKIVPPPSPAVAADAATPASTQADDLKKQLNAALLESQTTSDADVKKKDQDKVAALTDAINKLNDDAAKAAAAAAPTDWVSNARTKLITSPTISRTAVFVKLIPNADRVFSFDLTRSAFVQNKQIALTISSGLLLGYSINKGSEIEGFTTLPLYITKKIMEIPQDLLTVRINSTTGQQNLNNAEKSQYDSQSALNIDKTTQETAALNAQAAQLQAQTNLLQQQKALKAAQQSP